MNLAIILNEYSSTVMTFTIHFHRNILSSVSQWSDPTPYKIYKACAFMAIMFSQVYGYAAVLWLVISFILIEVHYLNIKVVTYSIIWGIQSSWRL